MVLRHSLLGFQGSGPLNEDIGQKVMMDVDTDGAFFLAAIALQLNEQAILFMNKPSSSLRASNFAPREKYPE